MNAQHRRAWTGRPPRTALRTLVVLALLTSATVVGPARPATAAPSLPAGFTVRDLPTGQSELLTDFAFAPDGSWFTVGKNGRVAWVSADGQPHTLAILSVVTVQDLGLTGVAVAADYATSRRLYTARALTVDGRTVMRLSAWTVAGSPEPAALTDEQVLWDLPVDADVHSMTGLVPAADGTLWVTIGDAADFRFVDPRALRALDVADGRGKMLHVLPDGRGVPDNPHYDPAAPSSWQSRVYASGFRSPFRMSLDPTSGAPILGDVGWNSWEEIDLLRPGASYGWPCWEGETPTPGYADLPGCQGVGNAAPLFTYPHGPAGTCVTGGIVYTGASYPEAYRGAYFFGDYASQRIYTMRYDAQGDVVRAPEPNGFGVENGLPVKFAAASNGDVVYADIGGSVLKRLVYVPGNRAPTAKITLRTDAATRTVTFDGSASGDLDGDAITYDWDFGDGTRGTGPQVPHTYPAGTSQTTARLTVTDPQGATGTAEVTVLPADGAPVISLSAPAADRLFAVGETVQASATASDAEDGVLPVTWSVVLVHCSGGYCHEHPGESFTGASFSRAFDDHGDNTRLEVTASAQDSSGVRVQQTFTANPRQRLLTVAATTPSAITVNGVARAESRVTVGATVSVIAPAVATDGVATFQGWDDGAPRSRTLTMPDEDLTLEARYLTPIDRRSAADAGVRAVLGAPTAPEAGDEALRYRTYAGGRLYWSSAAGAHELHGQILETYLADGGHLRYGEPLTDETSTPDGVGRFNHFAALGASIYWTPSTGAHVVEGAIRDRWAALGWERSYLGYPTSDEYPVPGGRRSDFQGGYVTWNATTGEVTDARR
ncbi:MAG: Glucose/sorbosone dehydrogenase [Modestobacter sp.]|nr:Glucose/sorbosone dehydrogenase [Modestobacter sp.]